MQALAAAHLHPHQPQPLLSNVAFSSRKRTRYRRGPQSGQTSLPDWVWGAGLGVIVLLFVAGFFIFSQTSGSGSTCDSPLAALTGATHPNTAEGFEQEDTDLGHLADFLRQGDINSANTYWYGPAHNFMHTAEPEIRAKDETLGKQLCEAVIAFETDFDPAPGTALQPDQLAAQVDTIRNHLRDGAVELGFARPGG